MPALDEGVDDGGVGEGGDVADLVGLVFGDFAEDAAHDFAGAGLGEAGGELDFLGYGDGADLLADMGGEILF